MAMWLSLLPYGSSRLSPLTLWLNLQHLGELYVCVSVSMCVYVCMCVINCTWMHLCGSA